MTHVPSSDANVFPEYILPAVVPLCHDKNEMVRSALARHIAEVGPNVLNSVTNRVCQILPLTWVWVVPPYCLGFRSNLPAARTVGTK